MNGKYFKISGRELVDVPCDIYLEGLNKATKASVRRASVPTEIRTKRLPITPTCFVSMETRYFFYEVGTEFLNVI
jgi:hypothetical protein